MARRSRTALVALIALALALALAVPIEASAAPPGCDNPADSALNQYCDAVPAATGAQQPRAGSPALGSSLGSPTGRRLAGRLARRPAARPLLRLPRPVTNRPLPARSVPAVGAISAIPLWLVLVILAAALLLAAGESSRRRRERGG